MYLIYIDGSGSVRNPNERHFVLAGVSVFERQIYHLIKEVEEFVARLKLGVPEDVELHASAMARGSVAPWKGIRRQGRLDIIENALKLLQESHWTNTLFAIIVDKMHCAPADPVEYAFEEICNRFNLQLKRIHRRAGGRAEGRQRGLVIMDESNYEGALQNLARTFRARGTRWGALRNMAEVPLFVDSRASRIVHLADLVAWAVWRRYEYADTRYFDKIVSRFDSEGGAMHGLVHYHPPGEECYCPACLSRRHVRGASGVSAAAGA